MQPLTVELRERRERIAELHRLKRVREERVKQANPYGGLLEFIRYFWRVLEPVDDFVDGWAVECLCAHLEAITRCDSIELNGQERTFNRLLANVPPGFMKSLTVNVFWPAWEWGPMGMPHLRYVAFSYVSDLTERDNAKFRDLVCSEAYKELWGHVFKVIGDPKAGKVRVTNDKTGFKFASSLLGVGTGERGHRVLLDDPHKLKGTAETPEARMATTQWVREAMQNRLNDLRRDAIVVIMQRLHEDDASGSIMEHLGDEYCHLIVPMEYESNRHFSHYTGWNEGEDPRTDDGELAWPERYPWSVLMSYKRNAYLWSGQYQQRPSPRGGGIFKDDWWQPYEVPTSGFYEFDPIFTLASLDTAFKEKEENDYSALTVWAVYDHPKTGQRRVMLTDAWHKKLPLHGKHVPRIAGETEKTYLKRASRDWGLCEWITFTCNKRGVERLVIEDSARGHDTAMEIQRLFMNEKWGVVLEPVKGGDKWDRAQAVVDIFTDDMVWAPGTWVGDMWTWRDFVKPVMDEMGSFPRGTHDDFVDSVVQALKYLRKLGLAIRREERHFLERAMLQYKKPLPPLYPV